MPFSNQITHVCCIKNESKQNRRIISKNKEDNNEFRDQFNDRSSFYLTGVWKERSMMIKDHPDKALLRSLETFPLKKFTAVIKFV